MVDKIVNTILAKEPAKLPSTVARSVHVIKFRL